MSYTTKINTPKQAKKILKAILQNQISGPPELIEALRNKCLRMINDERAAVIPLNPENHL
jgi:hypothetical protein